MRETCVLFPAIPLSTFKSQFIKIQERELMLTRVRLLFVKSRKAFKWFECVGTGPYLELYLGPPPSNLRIVCPALSKLFTMHPLR